MKYGPLIKLAEKSFTFLRFIENKKRPKNKNKVYFIPLVHYFIPRFLFLFRLLFIFSNKCYV